MAMGRWHFTRENKALVAILHLQSNRFIINLHYGILHFKEKATISLRAHLMEQRF